MAYDVFISYRRKTGVDDARRWYGESAKAGNAAAKSALSRLNGQ